MKNNTTAEKTYYVTFEDTNTAQVIKVTTSSELAAVAIAAPRCKCYNKSSVKVFTEEEIKQILGKRNSCRCYSGEDVLVYSEEYTNKIKLGSTQFFKTEKEMEVSKLLITLLVYVYDHESNMIVGSTRDFPYITIKAAAYDVEYAEPYIE